MKKRIIPLCICLAVSVTACSRSNDRNTPSQQLSSESIEPSSNIETEEQQGSQSISLPDALDQQPEIQVLLHIKGEEDGSGAVVYGASIQEIIDYLYDMQATDFQEEISATYCVEVHISIGDSYEVFEITTDKGSKTVDGKVLARKTDQSKYFSNNNSSSTENNDWFLIDADIWNTIGQHLYLPFTYKDGEFTSRPIDRLG